MSALSNDYTVQTYWTEALRDVTAGKSVVVPEWEKYNLVNRSQDNIAGLLYDLGSKAYQDSTTIVPSTAVKYGTTGTYNATTQRLTATLNTDFLSGDEGNQVDLRIGAVGYIGFIDSIISTTIVSLVGFSLPTTDQASFDTITVFSTSPTGSTISIAGLRMMRTGPQIKFELESTATSVIEELTTIGLRNFNTAATQNLNKVAFAISGSYALWKKGDSLTNAGTLTFRYPRVPLRRTDDADKIDIPDGPAIQLGIMNLSTLIARRSNIEVNERTKEEILTITQSLNSMFGKQFTLEQVQQKALALS